MTNPNLSEVVLIVDMSSSMSHLIRETIANISKFIKEQQEVPGEANFTLVYFDNNYYDKIYRQDIKKVNPKQEYSTYGSTALRDALGKTISRLGNDLRNTDEDKRPGHVIICTITDGLENASQEYSNTQIKSMIDVQRNVFSWQFIFMGAEKRSLLDAQSWGIPDNLTVNYVADAKGLEASYGALSSITRDFRTAESK